MDSRVSCIENIKLSQERFDVPSTIAVKGVPFEPKENLGLKVQKVVNDLKTYPPPGGDADLVYAKITDYFRMTQKFDTNKPGLVKIQFENENKKLAILRNKMTLKNIPLICEM